MKPADTITTADGRTISLSEFDATYAAMTPGEWFATETGFVYALDKWKERNRMSFRIDPGFVDHKERTDELECIADACGIVSLHNAYPAMRDEIRRLRERVAALEATTKPKMWPWDYGH